MTVARWLRFWSRHLLLLNLALLALAWLLYGSLEVYGHGHNYLARVRDFWLVRNPELFDEAPGIENVLLPGLAAAFAQLWSAAGWVFTATVFVIVAAVPYPLFIYAVTRHIGTHTRNGRLLAVGAAIALYTSGMIPYMASWGGYLDGLNYLLLVPVFLWPESLPAYLVAFVLQCLNHYLGAIALVLFAFVWHSMRALEWRDSRGAARYWLGSVVPRAVLSAAILAAFVWFWHTTYPDAAPERREEAVAKWRYPAEVLREVLGPFPWTLLSTLKLGIIPVAALMGAALPFRPLRMLVLGMPFLAATALTLVFVDVTRMATMLVVPALLVTIRAAAGESMPPRIRRRLRRLLIVTALLNLLIPNYYVSNGNIVVPPSNAIRAVIARAVEAARR